MTNTAPTKTSIKKVILTSWNVIVASLVLFLILAMAKANFFAWLILVVGAGYWIYARVMLRKWAKDPAARLLLDEVRKEMWRHRFRSGK